MGWTQDHTPYRGARAKSTAQCCLWPSDRDRKRVCGLNATLWLGGEIPIRGHWAAPSTISATCHQAAPRLSQGPVVCRFDRKTRSARKPPSSSRKDPNRRIYLGGDSQGCGLPWRGGQGTRLQQSQQVVPGRPFVATSARVLPTKPVSPIWQGSKPKLREIKCFAPNHTASQQ